MRKYFLPLGFLFLALVSVQPKKIELQRVIIPSQKMRHGSEQDEPFGSVQGQSFSIQNLINIFDQQYVGTIYIGEQYQPFKMILDSGSSIMWIPGSDCRNSCHTSYIYDYRNSQTSEHSSFESIRIIYGKGKCEGFLGSELASLENQGDLFRTPLMFSYSDTEMEGMQAHGLIGLSNDQSKDNLFEKAQKSGIINSSIFAFDLRKNYEQSTFYYDDIPSSQLKDIFYLPVIDSHNWIIEVIGWYIDGEDVSSYEQNVALVDTGSSYLYISKDLYTWLYNNYISKICFYNNINEVICPCDDQKLNSILPEIKFFLRGGVITISPSEYVVRQNKKCVLVVSYLPKFYVSVLGDVFLRNHFTLFDKANNQIGIKNMESKLSNIHVIALMVFLPLLASFSFIFLLSFYYQLIKTKQIMIPSSILSEALLSFNPSSNEVTIKQQNISLNSLL